MDTLTHAQRESLKTWSDQRDALLRDVSVLESKKESLSKENIALSQSNSALQQDIAESKGRLSEVQAVEDRFRESISKDVAELIAQKSKLEEELKTKEVQLKSVEDKKAEVISAISILVKTHESFFESVIDLEKVVGGVKKLSSDSISEMKVFTDNLKKSCEEIILINGSNTAQTKIVLDKIHKYIFELQRPIPIRRLPNKLK